MRGRGTQAAMTRRLRVIGDRIMTPVKRLADLQGYQLVEDDQDSDLLIVEVDQSLPEFPKDVPVLALSPRRLRCKSQRKLREAGATRVLDGEARMLDLALTLNALLFASAREHLAFARQNGGIPVELSSEKLRVQPGKLIGLVCHRAIILSGQAVASGAWLSMRFQLGSRMVRAIGRVVYARVSPNSDHEMGLEFLPGEFDVGPRLADLLAPGLS